MDAPVKNLGSWLFLGNIGLVHLMIIWCALTIDPVEPIETPEETTAQLQAEEAPAVPDAIGTAQAEWLDGGGCQRNSIWIAVC